MCRTWSSRETGSGTIAAAKTLVETALPETKVETARSLSGARHSRLKENSPASVSCSPSSKAETISDAICEKVMPLPP